MTEIPPQVEQIEKKLAHIDAQIAQLRREREAALMLDVEYACYIEHYQVCYSDEPLSIREYYRLMAEYEVINAEWNQPGADYDALWNKHSKRLQYLERVLGA